MGGNVANSSEPPEGVANSRKKFNPGITEPPLFVAARSAFHGSPRTLDWVGSHFLTFVAQRDGRVFAESLRILYAGQSSPFVKQ